MPHKLTCHLFLYGSAAGLMGKVLEPTDNNGYHTQLRLASVPCALQVTLVITPALGLNMIFSSGSSTSYLIALPFTLQPTSFLVGIHTHLKFYVFLFKWLKDVIPGQFFNNWNEQFIFIHVILYGGKKCFPNTFYQNGIIHFYLLELFLIILWQLQEATLEV